MTDPACVLPSSTNTCGSFTLKYRVCYAFIYAINESKRARKGPFYLDCLSRFSREIAQWVHVRESAYGVVGHWIDPSWWTH